MVYSVIQEGKCHMKCSYHNNIKVKKIGTLWGGQTWWCPNELPNCRVSRRTDLHGGLAQPLTEKDRFPRHQALSFHSGPVYGGRENYTWKTASHSGSPQVEWTLIWVNLDCRQVQDFNWLVSLKNKQDKLKTLREVEGESKLKYTLPFTICGI